MRSRGERATSEWLRAIVVGLALTLGLTASAAEERPKGGLGEGVKVHGHWTIEVMNPDGTLASRNEFENRLQNPSRLARILKGNTTVLDWLVVLSTTGVCAVPGAGGPAQACVMAQGVFTEPVTGTFYFQTLRVDVPETGPNAGKLVLTGTAKATFAGQVTHVLTENDTRGPLGEEREMFTGCALNGDAAFGPCEGISTPVDVRANQTIDVTVVISFS